MNNYTCVSCKWWNVMEDKKVPQSEYRECRNPHVGLMRSSLRGLYAEGCKATFTGPSFGCIHHEFQEMK